MPARVPPLNPNTNYVPNIAGAQQNALLTQSMGMQNALIGKNYELDAQAQELQKTALEIRQKALEQAGKPGPITLDYPTFSIMGEPQKIAAAAAIVSQFPDQVNDPGFMPWLASQGITYQIREQKEGSRTLEDKLKEKRAMLELEQEFKEPEKPEPLSYKDVVGLQKEFNQVPEVKEYITITTQMKRAAQAIAEARTGKGSMNAVDQSLITLLNKILDPTSVVRESEYARTPEGMSLLERGKGWLGRLEKGGAGLSPNEREAIYTMIDKFYEVSENSYNDQVKYYSDLATKKGVDPTEVIRLGAKSANLTGGGKPTSAGKYKVGTIYVDAQGRRAVYVGGNKQWELLKE